MSRRITGSSIAVSFSTRGILMPAWMVQHVAGAAEADGIDLDATFPLGVWLAKLTGASENPHIPIRSIWLSMDGARTPRTRRIIEDAIARQIDIPPLIVLTLPSAGGNRDVARSMNQIANAAQGWRIAVGLPSPALRGGRPHLVQLGVIRRFAEEWDIDVAVDLAGRFDPTWEAEAAISRLGNRLRILRVAASAPARTAVGRDRVACRALHAAIDRIDRLEIAISATAPVPFPVTPRAAARAADRAADYIGERVFVHAQALREGIDRFEDSPSPRGS